MSDWGTYNGLKVAVQDKVATVLLNRPDVKNAFNDELIAELTRCFNDISSSKKIRIVILTGEGDVFCSGADLNWMRKMANYTREENIADTQRMSEMFEAIDTCSKPVIGRINGSAFGGGVGLIAVCDIAIINKDAQFAFSEVKLGIVPAVISPYIVRKIGLGYARELFTTGERFNADRAKEIGLANHIGTMDEIEEMIAFKVKMLSSSGPVSIFEAKGLLRKLEELGTAEFRSFTAEKIAELRASDEGKEGIASFLEKRKPNWRD